jgi:hypothetical protein
VKKKTKRKRDLRRSAPQLSFWFYVLRNPKIRLIRDSAFILKRDLGENVRVCRYSHR